MPLDLEDVLVVAVHRTTSLIDQDRWSKLTQYAMTLCGRAVLAHVKPGDQGGLFAPIEVEIGTRWLNGCVLTLQDRAIFAWTTGTLRIRNFEHVVRYDDITEILQLDGLRRTAIAPEKRAFQVNTLGGSTSFRAMRLEGRPNIPELLSMVLTGAVSFDGPAPSPDAAAVGEEEAQS